MLNFRSFYVALSVSNYSVDSKITGNINLRIIRSVYVAIDTTWKAYQISTSLADILAGVRTEHLYPNFISELKYRDRSKHAHKILQETSINYFFLLRTGGNKIFLGLRSGVRENSIPLAHDTASPVGERREKLRSR